MAAPKEVGVTSEMIEMGYQVLRDLGITDDPLEVDRLLVERIFRAMFVLPSHQMKHVEKAAVEAAFVHECYQRVRIKARRFAGTFRKATGAINIPPGAHNFVVSADLHFIGTVHLTTTRSVSAAVIIR